MRVRQKMARMISGARRALQGLRSSSGSLSIGGGKSPQSYFERSEQFIRETKCKERGIENQTSDQGFLATLPNLVKTIEKEMAEKIKGCL